MAGILIYSKKCSHSMEMVLFINTNPVLRPMIQFHDINTQGIPSPHIKRVPTLVTKNNKLLIGKEIRAWLTSLIPSDISNCTLGAGAGLCVSSLDNPDGDDTGIFNLDNYGQSLQPVITPELQEKISKSVTDAFSSYNKD